MRGSKSVYIRVSVCLFVCIEFYCGVGNGRTGDGDGEGRCNDIGVEENNCHWNDWQGPRVQGYHVSVLEPF